MECAEAKWQTELLHAITDPQQSLQGISSAALDVYRNNYRASLINTLTATYPVIQALVGEEFFTGLVRMYLKQHASQSGNLHHYGQEFGSFLEHFGPAQEFPYLGDVARLEWRVHTARYALDAEPMNPAEFANVAPDNWPHLRLHFAPAVALVRSRWPIASIWQMHQPGAPADWQIDLDSGGEAALISRPGNQVQVDRLTPVTGAWLCALLRCATLEGATEQALECADAEDFQLQDTLQLLLARQALTGFEYEGPPEEDAI
jgi:hypothetical protein